MFQFYHLVYPIRNHFLWILNFFKSLLAFSYGTLRNYWLDWDFGNSFGIFSCFLKKDFSRRQELPIIKSDWNNWYHYKFGSSWSNSFCWTQCCLASYCYLWITKSGEEVDSLKSSSELEQVYISPIITVW